jgi:pyridoxal 5'-phosphate synthase pdxT subunit
MKKVGVLSLQGDFEAHGRALEREGVTPIFVRNREELQGLDGLIIPGGESTTMLKLMEYEDLLAPIADFGRQKPMFGTCAGAILMASQVSNPAQESLGLMDISVERNGYGRQIDSRVAQIDPEPPFEPGKLDAVFIRAPIIREVRGEAKVLARYNGDPVLVEQGRHLVSTFHPELTGDSRVHRYFLEKL